MQQEVLNTAQSILDTMLGYLDFHAEVKIEEIEGEAGLQVLTHDEEYLTGNDEEILDDLQYLVNRMLQVKHPEAPRIRVDVQYRRAMKEDAFISRIKKLAERVRQNGEVIKLDPMNGYQRRLVHQAFKNDPEVETKSPEDQARIKRITLIPRK